MRDRGVMKVDVSSGRRKRIFENDCLELKLRIRTILCLRERLKAKQERGWVKVHQWTLYLVLFAFLGPEGSCRIRTKLLNKLSGISNNK